MRHAHVVGVYALGRPVLVIHPPVKLVPFHGAHGRGTAVVLGAFGEHLAVVVAEAAGDLLAVLVDDANALLHSKGSVAFGDVRREQRQAAYHRVRTRAVHFDRSVDRHREDPLLLTFRRDLRGKKRGPDALPSEHASL